MKKTLADWAAIAEVVGSVAIVISLIFVGLQIRAGTRVAQSTMYQNLMSQEIAILQQVGSSPEMTDLYNRAFTSPDQLDPSERPQATYLRTATMRLWEGFYLQYQAGTLSQDGWESRERLIRRMVRNLPRETVASDEFGGSFRDYMLNLQAQRPVAISIAPQLLQSYVGVYAGDASTIGAADGRVTIHQSNGRLLMRFGESSDIEFAPLSETEFFSVTDTEGRLLFNDVQNGLAQQVLVRAPSGDEMKAMRVADRP